MDWFAQTIQFIFHFAALLACVGHIWFYDIDRIIALGKFHVNISSVLLDNWFATYENNLHHYWLIVNGFENVWKSECQYWGP